MSRWVGESRNAGTVPLGSISAALMVVIVWRWIHDVGSPTALSSTVQRSDDGKHGELTWPHAEILLGLLLNTSAPPTRWSGRTTKSDLRLGERLDGFNADQARNRRSDIAGKHKEWTRFHAASYK